MAVKHTETLSFRTLVILNTGEVLVFWGFGHHKKAVEWLLQKELI